MQVNVPNQCGDFSLSNTRLQALADALCVISQLYVSPPLDLLHGHIQRVYHASGWTNQVSVCCHVRLSCYGIIQLHQWVRTIIKRFSSILMDLKLHILILRNGRGESLEKWRFRSRGRVCLGFLKVKFDMKTLTAGVEEAGQDFNVWFDPNRLISSIKWKKEM